MLAADSIKDNSSKFEIPLMLRENSIVVENGSMRQVPVKELSVPAIFNPVVSNDDSSALEFDFWKLLTQEQPDTNQANIESENLEKLNFVKLIYSNDSSIFHPPGKPLQFNQPIVSTSLQKTLLPIERIDLKRENSGWILSLALISAIIFIVLRTLFSKTVSSIVSTSLNIQIAEKLLREKNNIVRRAFLLLNLNFVLSISFFIYLFLYRYLKLLPIENHLYGFLLITLFLFVYLLIRLLLMRLIAFFFSAKKVMGEYIHSIYLINKNMGIFILPINFSIVYTIEILSRVLIFIGLGIILVFVLLRIFRSIQIIIKSRVFLFYSILYFWALEILPLLLGFKLLKLM